MQKKSSQSFSEKQNLYKIRNINLHEFGRKEIDLALTEMPGLTALRSEFGILRPLLGRKITGSLHMTIQTAVLIETLKHLGADLRWCSCNIFSTQDHAAAAIAQEGSASVFAWKGESIQDYWWCVERSLTWPDGSGPDLVVDDGGDATLLIHEGVKAEIHFAATGQLPEIKEDDTDERKEMVALLQKSVKATPDKWRKMAAKCLGVSEETTTGVCRLKQLVERDELLFPAINVNDSVTKSKFDNIYGCKHSLTDGIKRATDILISGKTVLICGFGDVGKGCAAAMKAEGAKVFVSEIDPICALQACMEGYSVRRVEDVVAEADIFVTATGNKGVILKEHMAAMKNNAVVCNIGHFDNEIDMAGLEKDQNIRRDNIKPQVDRFIFPDGKGILVLAEGRLVNLGCATGHPSFVMSSSFTNQVLAQIDLCRNGVEKKYKNDVYVLSKTLDEKVARLHLPSFAAELTELTESQSEYSGIPVQGPYKGDHYRY